MSFESQSLEADIRAPERGQVCVIAVDVTPRAYNITLLPFNGDSWAPNQQQHLFLTVQNTGASDFGFYFSATPDVDIDPAATVAAGGTPVLDNTHCPILRAGNDTPVHLDRSHHKYLCIRTVSGTSTVRLVVSSCSSPRAQ